MLAALAGAAAAPEPATGANGLIGRYRFLLWEVEPTQSVSQPVLDNTFYAEFDVHGNP